VGAGVAAASSSRARGAIGVARRTSGSVTEDGSAAPLESDDRARLDDGARPFTGFVGAAGFPRSDS
jgi:hypothetical protein